VVVVEEDVDIVWVVGIGGGVVRVGFDVGGGWAGEGIVGVFDGDFDGVVEDEVDDVATLDVTIVALVSLVELGISVTYLPKYP
jgi:hypothetical protein